MQGGELDPVSCLTLHKAISTSRTRDLLNDRRGGVCQAACVTAVIPNGACPGGVIVDRGSLRAVDPIRAEQARRQVIACHGVGTCRKAYKKKRHGQ